MSGYRLLPPSPTPGSHLNEGSSALHPPLRWLWETMIVLAIKTRLLTHSCCVVTKGHTYLSKPVGKRSKSTKSEVFLNFLNKFEDIGK